MATRTTSGKDRVARLLAQYGRTYSGELGIDLARNTPSPLFRWLCASVLFSTRISADIALSACRALAAAGWTTPERMAQSTWAERTRVLNRSGYARYDESTSRMLGRDAELLISEYRGDLRLLRRRADHDPGRERGLLKAFSGIGDVGADIFLREVQVAWDELYPFADRKASLAAHKLGLGRSAGELAHFVNRHDYPRLIAAFVRVDLANAYDQFLSATPLTRERQRRTSSRPHRHSTPEPRAD